MSVQAEANTIESRALRTRLRSTPDSVAEGRRRVSDVLSLWEVPISPETADAVQVVASELLTNAIRVEPGAGVTLCVSFQSHCLRIAVHDASPCLVVPDDEAGELAEGGRGLAVVVALASDWGWHSIPGGIQDRRD